jgi:hypothetical protein
MRCNECGEEFDPADLTQVLYHFTHGPVAVVEDADGNPIFGEPVEGDDG